MKKEIILYLLKKYNKNKIKYVNKIDPLLCGSILKENIKVTFDINDRFLIIQK